MKSSDLILFNTFVLYTKLVLAIVFGIFTSRFVYLALGEVNYGLYSLIGGVVGMLSFLNSTMTISTLRFLSYSLGEGVRENILKTFNTSLLIHFVLAILIAIILEIGGYFMFQGFLDIPEGKLDDALWVFHFMVITSIVTVISVPYDAVITAHENLLALSIIDTVGVVLKLIMAIYLTYMDGDTLVLYGFLLLVIQLIMRFAKQFYSIRNYDECKIRFKGNIDKPLIKKIMSFALWNLLGSLSSISVVQIKSVFLNTYFGVLLNTANGISMTISTYVNNFAVSLTNAFKPQMMKSEGGGDRKKVIRLTGLSTKFSIYLYCLIGIPVYLEIEYLLHIWLGDVPDFTVIFARLILINILIEKFSFEITNAIKAVGDIKNFQIVDSLIKILSVPLIYVFLELGYSAEYVFYSGILVSIMAFGSRLYFGRLKVKINIRNYLLHNVLSPMLPVILTVLGITAFIAVYQQGLDRLVLSSLMSVLLLVSFIWYLGLVKDEKVIIQELLIKVKNKIPRLNK